MCAATMLLPVASHQQQQQVLVLQLGGFDFVAMTLALVTTMVPPRLT